MVSSAMDGFHIRVFVIHPHWHLKSFDDGDIFLCFFRDSDGKLYSVGSQHVRQSLWNPCMVPCWAWRVTSVCVIHQYLHSFLHIFRVLT